MIGEKIPFSRTRCNPPERTWCRHDSIIPNCPHLPESTYANWRLTIRTKTLSIYVYGCPAKGFSSRQIRHEHRSARRHRRVVMFPNFVCWHSLASSSDHLKPCLAPGFLPWDITASAYLLCESVLLALTDLFCRYFRYGSIMYVTFIRFILRGWIYYSPDKPILILRATPSTLGPYAFKGLKFTWITSWPLHRLKINHIYATVRPLPYANVANACKLTPYLSLSQVAQLTLLTAITQVERDIYPHVSDTFI